MEAPNTQNECIVPKTVRERGIFSKHLRILPNRYKGFSSAIELYKRVHRLRKNPFKVATLVTQDFNYNILCVEYGPNLYLYFYRDDVSDYRNRARYLGKIIIKGKQELLIGYSQIAKVDLELKYLGLFGVTCDNLNKDACLMEMYMLDESQRNKFFDFYLLKSPTCDVYQTIIGKTVMGEPCSPNMEKTNDL